jgi:hypothetical protein
MCSLDCWGLNARDRRPERSGCDTVEGRPGFLIVSTGREGPANATGILLKSRAGGSTGYSAETGLAGKVVARGIALAFYCPCVPSSPYPRARADAAQHDWCVVYLEAVSNYDAS